MPECHPAQLDRRQQPGVFAMRRIALPWYGLPVFALRAGAFASGSLRQWWFQQLKNGS